MTTETERVTTYFGEDVAGSTWARVAIERLYVDGSWREDPHLHASVRVQPGRDRVAALRLASASFGALLRRATSVALTIAHHQQGK